MVPGDDPNHLTVRGTAKLSGTYRHTDGRTYRFKETHTVRTRPERGSEETRENFITFGRRKWGLIPQHLTLKVGGDLFYNLEEKIYTLAESAENVDDLSNSGFTPVLEVLGYTGVEQYRANTSVARKSQGREVRLPPIFVSDAHPFQHLPEKPMKTATAVQ